MIKSFVKNLIRFLFYALLASVLWNLDKITYIIWFLFTILFLVAFYCLKDLSKALKVTSVIRSIVGEEFDARKFMITALIYTSALLTPIVFWISALLIEAVTK